MQKHTQEVLECYFKFIVRFRKYTYTVEHNFVFCEELGKHILSHIPKSCICGKNINQ